MDKKEFEDIIRPLVMLPNDQRKLLKEVLMKNFNKWAENKQLTLTNVVGRSEQLKINKIKTFKKWKSEYATKIHNDLFLYNEVEVTSKKLKELYDAGVKLMS